MELIPGTPMKILTSPVYFTLDGETIKIPAGFAFDGMSVPRLLQFIVDMNHSDNIMAACIHDHFYSSICKQKITRRVADLDLYYRVRFPPNILVYLGVRFGGWLSWKKDSNYKKYKKSIERARKRLNLPSLTK